MSLSSKSLISNKLLRWQLVSIVLLFALLSIGLIWVGVRSKDQVLSLVVIACGGSVLSGCILGLAFKFWLLESVRGSIRFEIDESLRSLHAVLDRIRRAGILDAYSHINIPKYVKEIRSREIRPDEVVFVHQSWVHHLDSFLSIARTAVDRNVEVKFLIGHPAHTLVQGRFLETHPATSEDGAQSQMAKQLDDFLVLLLQKEKTRRALQDRAIEIRLWRGRPIAPIFGLGREMLVGWFPFDRFGIDTPCLHCSSESEYNQPTIGSNWKEQFDDMWDKSPRIVVGTNGCVSVPPLRGAPDGVTAVRYGP